MTPSSPSRSAPRLNNVLSSWVFAAAVVVSCSSGSDANPTQTPPADYPLLTLTYDSGAFHQREGGTSLNVAIHVKKADGSPAIAVPVLWDAQPNNGIIWFATTQTSTDSLGKAMATWIIGPNEKADTLFVRVDGAEDLRLLAWSYTAPARIEVTPWKFAAAAGDTIYLNGLGRDPNDFVRYPPMTWTVDGPAFALEPIDSANARAIAVSPGVVTATATHIRLPWVIGTSQLKVSNTPADYQSLFVGPVGACALNSSAAALCWGYNFNDQLATGIVEECSQAVCTRVASPVKGGLQFASLSVGQKNTCGLMADGTAYCWGDNLWGQVGDGKGGTSFPQTSPVAVKTTVRFKSVAVGVVDVCALSLDDHPYCWGQSFGEPVAGVPAGRTPQLVSPETFSRISGGNGSWCAVHTNGDLYCWGGLSPYTSGGTSSSPAPVASDAKYTEVSANGSHACAITVSGDVRCFGLTYNGELGDGVFGFHMIGSPTAVLTATKFTQVASGADGTCALSVASLVYCWGEGGMGQLGNGGVGSKSVPTPVSGDRTFVSIGMGSGYACARTSSARVYCWGSGYYGSRGDGGAITKVIVPRLASNPF